MTSPHANADISTTERRDATILCTGGFTNTTTAVPEALEDYRDVEELPDGRFVRLHVWELFGLRGGGDNDPVYGALCDVWAYVITARGQLAFLAYPCVKKGVCERRALHLEHFDDQKVAAAVTLLLSEHEPAIALSPIASRVRRVQLAVLTSGLWDILKLDTFERENRLLLLG